MVDHSSNRRDLYYRKITRIDSNEICLDADMIRLLIAIDKSKHIDELATEVGMDDPTMQATLRKLMDLKLIEPVRKTGDAVGARFVNQLKNQLARAVGPMAEILIEDLAADMGGPLAELSRSQAAELISSLAVEIPDQETRVQFTRSMLDIIKSQ